MKGCVGILLHLYFKGRKYSVYLTIIKQHLQHNKLRVCMHTRAYIVCGPSSLHFGYVMYNKFVIRKEKTIAATTTTTTQIKQRSKIESVSYIIYIT